jgi:hypothetical protein
VGGKGGGKGFGGRGGGGGGRGGGRGGFDEAFHSANALLNCVNSNTFKAKHVKHVTLDVSDHKIIVEVTSAEQSPVLVRSPITITTVC